MVKHIILWKLRSDLSAEEKQAKALAIKQGLEGLQGKVPGLVDIHVQIDGRLDSSNADIMLDSTLESEDALKGYAVVCQQLFWQVLSNAQWSETPFVMYR